jgi:hypothetical protein
MVGRLIPMLTLWGMSVAVAWLVAHAYIITVSEKLEQISRALGKL